MPKREIEAISNETETKNLLLNIFENAYDSEIIKPHPCNPDVFSREGCGKPAVMKTIYLQLQYILQVSV